MKTREQNRNNKRTEIERFDWFIERIQPCVAFGWVKKLHARELSRNQPILRFVHTTTRLPNRTMPSSC